MLKVCSFFTRLLLIGAPVNICTVQVISVSEQSELDVFSNCPTVTGDITISDTTMAAVTIPSGVQAIEGSVYIENNTSIDSIRAQSLVNITGEIAIGNLTSLTAFDMPALMFVGDTQTEYGGLDFWGLPMLQNLSLPSLTEIGWIIVISDDPSESLYVELPELTVSWAGAFFQGVASLDISSLTTVGPGTHNNDAIIFSGIQNFATLSAPSLTNVTSLEVVGSPGLTSLSFPYLTSISGSLTITNNPGLLDIVGFPALQTVGKIEITGSFTSVSFPNLDEINGDVIIQSSSNEFVCPISGFESEVVSQGYTFSCGSISGSPSSENTANKSNDAGEIVGGIFLLILIAIIYGCCCRGKGQRGASRGRNATPVNRINRGLDEVYGLSWRGFGWMTNEMIRSAS
jgi:hypothetical protein